MHCRLCTLSTPQPDFEEVLSKYSVLVTTVLKEFLMWKHVVQTVEVHFLGECQQDFIQRCHMTWLEIREFLRATCGVSVLEKSEIC